jgi:hypothetical protein
VQFGALAATLELSTTATINGAITANASVNDTLILDSKGSGALAGFGSVVTGFTTIDEENKADWSLTGTITGGGVLAMGNDATLALSGNISIATLSFGAGGNDILDMAKSTPLTSALSGFGSGDVIDLAGIQASSLKYAGQTLTLLGTNGSVVDTLTFDGKYTQADFALQAVHGGTDLLFAGSESPADFLPEIFGQQPGGLIGLAPEPGGLHILNDFARSLENTILFHATGATFGI